MTTSKMYTYAISNLQNIHLQYLI